VGPALDKLDQIWASEDAPLYDFAYIDADKQNYSNYVERLLNLLRPGGFIMLDNTLWRGAVADPEKR
jgi:caffeoyl-CoA O-methyltransferase